MMQHSREIMPSHTLSYPDKKTFQSYIDLVVLRSDGRSNADMHSATRAENTCRKNRTATKHEVRSTQSAGVNRISHVEYF